MTFAEQAQLESTYVMGTYARKPVQLVCGQGMKVEDSEGRVYLDFVSGVGAVSLGHCHPEFVAALEKQMQKLAHVSNYYYTEHRGEVAQKLSDLLNVASNSEEQILWKSFFSNSGAESNECAFKLARLHAKKQAALKVRQNGGSEDEIRQAEQTAPRLIVTLDRSFHGRTLATLAATAQPVKQEAFQPLPAGFIRTPINDIEALEKLFEEQGASICACMVECVQGESGIHPCTAEFLQTMRRLTSDHGALFMCDEIQCGIYRCGTYPFGFQHFDVVPDVVTIAKGVASGFPTGMCSARSEVAASFEAGDHGSTFGGSCLATAAALATLTVLEEGDFLTSVERVGRYLREKLASLPQITNVRGLGLMVAAELPESFSALDVVAAGLNGGLLLNYTDCQTLRFLPPLVCTEADVDVLIQSLSEIFIALAD